MKTPKLDNVGDIHILLPYSVSLQVGLLQLMPVIPLSSVKASMGKDNYKD